MKRDVHISAQDLLNFLQFKEGDFADIALVSGQPQRAKMCLDKLENPVKNFSFLGYTFWTGFYKGKRVTVGNGGFYAPDSAFVTELLCVGGVNTLIRLGSCGALRDDIEIGDFIVADKVLRGDGATRYYVDDDFVPYTDKDLTASLKDVFLQGGNKVHIVGVWTTDALLKETREFVNSYIDKGAIAVDMVSSPFVTIANLYRRKVAVVLVVSDNLITGELGFTDFRVFDSQQKMVDLAFKLVEEIGG